MSLNMFWIGAKSGVRKLSMMSCTNSTSQLSKMSVMRKQCWLKNPTQRRSLSQS